MSGSDRKEAVGEAAEIARGALRILHAPSRWTKHEWGLNSRGQIVAVDDTAATRFCLVGALLRSEHELHGVKVRYERVPSAGRPLVGDRSGRLKLVLDLLAHAVREELSEAGLQLPLARLEEASSLRAKRSTIHGHDLPIAY